MNMQAAAEDILRRLQDAFPRMPVPRRDRVAGGSGGPDDAYAVKHFGGKVWDTVPLNAGMVEDLSYMSPEALAYYLPAFLAFTLRAENLTDCDFNEFFLSFLGMVQKPRKYGVAWPDLSREQAAVVLRWADHVRQHVKAYAWYEVGRKRDPGDVVGEFRDWLARQRNGGDRGTSPIR